MKVYFKKLIGNSEHLNFMNLEIIGACVACEYAVAFSCNIIVRVRKAYIRMCACVAVIIYP